MLTNLSTQLVLILAPLAANLRRMVYSIRHHANVLLASVPGLSTRANGSQRLRPTFDRRSRRYQPRPYSVSVPSDGDAPQSRASRGSGGDNHRPEGADPVGLLGLSLSWMGDDRTGATLGSEYEKGGRVGDDLNYSRFLFRNVPRNLRKWQKLAENR